MKNGYFARKCNGEIVSADSRQVYRFMDIGTAKPTLHERKEIIHHCIDIKNPDEFFSAGEYGRLARKIIDDIFARKNFPIVVGGSGLYIRALVDGVFVGNYRDSVLRDRLKIEAEKRGILSLYKKLSEVDPVAAQKIHPNDSKRIIRALVVYELSGKPISTIQKEKTKPADFVPTFWGLHWERENLYKRIERRVDNMIKSGLVEEVKKLKEMGFDTRYNSLDSMGYKEVFDYLDGKTTFDEMVDLIKRNTRRFAKKQLTWFRQDSRINWIDLEEPVDWDEVTQQVLHEK